MYSFTSVINAVNAHWLSLLIAPNIAHAAACAVCPSVLMVAWGQRHTFVVLGVGVASIFKSYPLETLLHLAQAVAALTLHSRRVLVSISVCVE
jgi:hypothetical protein